MDRARLTEAQQDEAQELASTYLGGLTRPAPHVADTAALAARFPAQADLIRAAGLRVEVTPQDAARAEAWAANMAASAGNREDAERADGDLSEDDLGG